MNTDDEISISILKTFAQTHLGPVTGERPSDPELQYALTTAFGSPEPATVTEGDLARAHHDPDFAALIQLTASQIDARSSRYRYVEPMTIGLGAAALLALQTRVKFKLDSTHKWSIEVDKKSAGEGTLKLLAQRLLLFLGK
jgi:hypothetical protein